MYLFTSASLESARGNVAEVRAWLECSLATLQLQDRYGSPPLIGPRESGDATLPRLDQSELAVAFSGHFFFFL